MNLKKLIKFIKINIVYEILCWRHRGKMLRVAGMFPMNFIIKKK